MEFSNEREFVHHHEMNTEDYEVLIDVFVETMRGGRNGTLTNVRLRNDTLALIRRDADKVIKWLRNRDKIVAAKDKLDECMERYGTPIMTEHNYEDFDDF